MPRSSDVFVDEAVRHSSSRQHESEASRLSGVSHATSTSPATSDPGVDSSRAPHLRSCAGSRCRPGHRPPAAELSLLVVQYSAQGSGDRSSCLTYSLSDGVDVVVAGRCLPVSNRSNACHQIVPGLYHFGCEHRRDTMGALVEYRAGNYDRMLRLAQPRAGNGRGNVVPRPARCQCRGARHQDR